MPRWRPMGSHSGTRKRRRVFGALLGLGAVTEMEPETLNGEILEATSQVRQALSNMGDTRERTCTLDS